MQRRSCHFLAARPIASIGPAPAKGSSGRCQSETAARKAEPLTGSGPKRQCLPGVAARSPSLRGGTASSNRSSSSGPAAANLVDPALDRQTVELFDRQRDKQLDAVFED